MTSTSILSLPSTEPVSNDFLKKTGFKKISWGAPKKVSYVTVRGQKLRKLNFDKSQYCWEWFDDDNQLDDYYKTLIYYYPAGFDGYVVPFQGDWKNPLNPENYAYVTIDNSSAEWHEKVYIESENDLEVAFAIAKQRISYLNNKFFGI